LKPVYTITANDSDITAKVKDRLTELTITDETGHQSDRVTIALDDRGNPFVLPEKGAQLNISIGIEKSGAAPLVDMGTFVVDEVTAAGPPDRIIIEAKAADMTARLKGKKSRAWDNVTLSDIVSTIARAHNLTPVVGSDLSAIRFPHLDQTNESDMHLLRRLGREHDAVVKPASGRLVMVKKGQVKTATGKSLPLVSLTRKDFVEPGWEMTARDRGKYKSVTAFYQDINGGEKKKVTVGDGPPASILPSPFADETRALRAAQARLEKLARRTASLTGTVSSRTDLIAEGKINITGIREGINGSWILTKVTYKITDSGFTVSFTSEVPKD